MCKTCLFSPATIWYNRSKRNPNFLSRRRILFLNSFGWQAVSFCAKRKLASGWADIRYERKQLKNFSFLRTGNQMGFLSFGLSCPAVFHAVQFQYFGNEQAIAVGGFRFGFGDCLAWQNNNGGAVVCQKKLAKFRSSRFLDFLSG